MANATCSIDGCDRTDVIPLSSFCDPHHRRARRNGDPGDAYVGRPRGACALPKGPCLVDECGVTGRIKGYCRSHARLLAVHGDPTTRLKPGLPVGRAPAGEAAAAWRGGTAAYSAVHHRLRRAYGYATAHSCVDCTGPAQHWSYMYGSPTEERDEQGRAYCHDLTWYQPRCIPCHRDYDRAHAA